MNSTAHALIGSVLAGAEETASAALISPAILPPGCDRLWSLIRDAWAEGRQPTPESLRAAAPQQAPLILDCLHASVNPAEADYLASRILESHDREKLRSHLVRTQGSLFRRRIILLLITASNSLAAMGTSCPMWWRMRLKNSCMGFWRTTRRHVR